MGTLGIPFRPAPRPRVFCAVCGKPVERVEVSRLYDVEALVIAASCHGDVWSFRIGLMQQEQHPEVINAILNGDVIGLAFSQSQDNVIPVYVGPLPDGGPQRIAPMVPALMAPRQPE